MIVREEGAFGARRYPSCVRAEGVVEEDYFWVCGHCQWSMLIYIIKTDKKELRKVPKEIHNYELQPSPLHFAPLERSSSRGPFGDRIKAEIVLETSKCNYRSCKQNQSFLPQVAFRADSSGT